VRFPNRLRNRALTIFAALTLIGGTAAVVNAATSSPAVAYSCSHSWTDPNMLPDWGTWLPAPYYWFQFGNFVTCHHSGTFTTYGFSSDRNECADVRVRFLNSHGHTDHVDPPTGWDTVCGYGSQIRIYGFEILNQPQILECRSHYPAINNQNRWCLFHYSH